MQAFLGGHCTWWRRGNLLTKQPIVAFHVETKPNDECLYEMQQWVKMAESIWFKNFLIARKILTFFWPMFPFYTYRKQQKLGFTVFTGGTKLEYRPEMEQHEFLRLS